MIGVVAIFKNLCETTHYILVRVGVVPIFKHQQMQVFRFKKEKKKKPKTRFKDITMH